MIFKHLLLVLQFLHLPHQAINGGLHLLAGRLIELVSVLEVGFQLLVGFLEVVVQHKQLLVLQLDAVQLVFKLLDPGRLLADRSQVNLSLLHLFL